jgi:ribosomal protein S18 acetylase RimI-like enzyme
MSAYRFCRTDDIGLLVEALNRCWAPYYPDEPPATAAAFKRSIRDLQVWCSSCMVAFSGSDPIGVLIGAKRNSETLIHKIAVHPDYVRQGHGGHLLESLSSKLAILGPPRIVAEVPDSHEAARGLFTAGGYVEEAVLTDYVLEEEAAGREELPGRLVIPVTVDDLAANGLLEPEAAPLCWQRSVETLMGRKNDIAGLAVASDESIEACILYIEDGEVAMLRSFFADAGTRLKVLVARLRGAGLRTLRIPKVHHTESAAGFLRALGFRNAGTHRLYAKMAGAS